MDELKKVFEYFNGKKTYLIGLAGLIWGLYQNDKEIILVALGLLGFRHGLNTEMNGLLSRLTKK